MLSYSYQMSYKRKTHDEISQCTITDRFHVDHVKANKHVLETTNLYSSHMHQDRQEP